MNFGDVFFWFGDFLIEANGRWVAGIGGVLVGDLFFEWGGVGGMIVLGCLVFPLFAGWFFHP